MPNGGNESFRHTTNTHQHTQHTSHTSHTPTHRYGPSERRRLSCINHRKPTSTQATAHMSGTIDKTVTVQSPKRKAHALAHQRAAEAQTSKKQRTTPPEEEQVRTIQSIPSSTSDSDSDFDINQPLVKKIKCKLLKKLNQVRRQDLITMQQIIKTQILIARQKDAETMKAIIAHRIYQKHSHAKGFQVKQEC